MIADPDGPSFITRTVGRCRYADNASVSRDPGRTRETLRSGARCAVRSARQKVLLAFRGSGNTLYYVAPQFLRGVRSACSRPTVENLISRDHGRALRGENVSVTTIPPAASAF